MERGVKKNRVSPGKSLNGNRGKNPKTRDIARGGTDKRKGHAEGAELHIASLCSTQDYRNAGPGALAASRVKGALNTGAIDWNFVQSYKGRQTRIRKSTVAWGGGII